MKRILKNKPVYLAISILAFLLIMAIGIYTLFYYLKIRTGYQYIYGAFGLYCVVGTRICLKEFTSRLVIVDDGVANEFSVNNIRMKWNEIIRIEYCGSRNTFNERIVLHNEKDNRIFVSIHRVGYLDAIKMIVTQCIAHNSDVLIDESLKVRLKSLN